MRLASLRPVLAASRKPSLIVALVVLGGCRTAGTPQTDREPQRSDEPATVTTEKQIERVTVTNTAVEDLEVAFKRAIRRASPAVVSIYTTKTMRLPVPLSPFGEGFPFEPLLPPGSTPGSTQEFTQLGLGSGFIFDQAGHILTNNHVIAGADEIRIKLADDREFEVKVIGTDPPTDLALLQIDAEQLDDIEPVELGDSAALEVGDWVVAIGDPFGLPQTVSVGIVSAKGRANMGIVDFEDFIQTDAAINPGNSGGPLVDLDGRVVGISTAIASRGGGSEGIAFAIPIDMAKHVVDQLLRTGKVTRGNLGVLISPLTDDLAQSFSFEGEAGILVQDVLDDSAAAKAGLRDGDIITRLDGQPVDDVTQFRSTIAGKQPGDRVTLEIWRGGRAEQREVTLGEASGPTSAAQQQQQPNERLELGLVLEDVTPQLRRQYRLEAQRGVAITGVAPGSPAAGAGLRPGDVLEQIGDREVESAAQAARLLRDADLREGVRLRVRRDGSGRYVFIKVE